MFAPHRIASATAVALLMAVAFGCSKSAAAGSSASSGSSSQSKIEANLTDLPTYPNLTSGSMLGHPPTQGAVYNATTNDPYPTVVAWYKARLTGATEKHSGYIDSTTGHKEIEFHMAKWNEQVMIDADPKYSGVSIALGQDAHH